MTQQQLAWLANATIPFLLCVFISCSIGALPASKRAAAFACRVALALLITFVLAHINHWMVLWKGHHLFPSGHMTFYLSVATSFFLLDRRSAILTVPVALLYAWLIVDLDYHSWLDLFGAMILSIPVTLYCHRYILPNAEKEPA